MLPEFSTCLLYQSVELHLSFMKSDLWFWVMPRNLEYLGQDAATRLALR